MKKHLLILLLISGADFAAGYNPNLVDDIIITPPNPTELDEISVTVWFSGGPFVNTHWNIIDGNTVRIRMVKDGLDLAPNPPSVSVEKITRYLRVLTTSL